MAVPFKFPLYDSGEQVITWADGTDDLFPDFLVCYTLGLGDTRGSYVASHLHALDSRLL